MSQEHVYDGEALTGKVTGKVKAVNDQSEKPYYGVNIDGQWFNGENSTDIGKGDTVELTVRKKDDDQFIDIINVSILEEADDSVERGEGSSRESAQENSASKNLEGGESASSTTFQSQKSRDITVKVATKLAVEHADTRPKDQAEHLNEVNELANGYKNIMQGLLKEINNQGEQ